MKQKYSRILWIAFIFTLTHSLPGIYGSEKIVRPNEIKSKRQVVYDDTTYAKLNRLWKAYYEEYPSEYAYANWMYAARYAGDDSYSGLLAKGLNKYQANATLLYLKALERLGTHDNTESRKYLEQAIAIDQNFTDPWYPLVTHYMDARDDERLNLALRRILESGLTTDEVMDYNYNVLASLDENAILITNGDNDTYPAWIQTRILKVRPDVTIVNRSLLNTNWYPLYTIEQGLPRFIDKSELESLRNSLLSEIKQSGRKASHGGPFGDTLILKLIESAKLSGRPVYLAKTVFMTDMLESVVNKGQNLGLVILVTPSNVSPEVMLKQAYSRWLDSFRTAGLQSWRLRHAPQTDAGRMIVCNYAAGIVDNLASLKKHAPELPLKLFRWYIEYVEGLLSEEKRSETAMAWCRNAADIKEIGAWSKQQGINCEERTKQ